MAEELKLLVVEKHTILLGPPGYVDQILLEEGCIVHTGNRSLSHKGDRAAFSRVSSAALLVDRGDDLVLELGRKNLDLALIKRFLPDNVDGVG